MKWIQNNGTFRQINDTDLENQLEVGVYRMHQDRNGIFLVHETEAFILPTKQYGIAQPFIERVMTWWHNTDRNVGILLSGTKGTGKSVSAKTIANMTNLPVIVIDDKYKFFSFINDINQDVVVFIDEFEKIMQMKGDDDDDDELSSEPGFLSLLDGCNTNSFKRMFLLTSNNSYVDQFLLNRPGRIRYHKEFNSLSSEIVFEIVDDLLLNKDFREDLIRTIGILEYITIDTVKGLIDEVNFFNQKASVLMDDFNLSFDESRVSWWIEDINLNTHEATNLRLLGSRLKRQTRLFFDDDNIGDGVYWKNDILGRVYDVDDVSMPILEVKKDGEVKGYIRLSFKDQYVSKLKPNTLE